jgi:peptidoglycan/LPS O-acetylase OafA/YrhL
VRRMPELDALRGLAALAIVVYHLWFPQVTLLGTAVDLFFVMSGYLITTIILKELGRPQFLRTFYIRRALRIWPIYYLALFATVGTCLSLSPPEPLEALPDYLLYLQRVQSYWFGREPAFFEGFSHTWTLAIEEQFYLAWPLLLVALGRRALVPMAVGIATIAVLARAAGFGTWILLTRSDGLALGGLLAAMLSGETDSRRIDRRLAMALGLAIVIRIVGTIRPASLPEPAALSLRMLSVNLGYFALTGVMVRRSGATWLGVLRLRPLVALGKISYGIYLYHYIVFHLLDRLGWTHRAGADALKLALSFGLAMLSWRFIERPILGLKERFDYTKQAERAQLSGGRSPVAASG